MNSTRFLQLAASLGVLALAGCQTPQSRIQSNPEAFARLAPTQQALVAAGQIAVGLDMGAVKIALGDPNRVTVRTTAAGQSQIWHYVTYDYGYPYWGYGGGYYGGYWGGRGFYGRGRWGGGWGGWGVGYPLGYPERAHDRIRVTFDANGRVASFQEERP